jgi:carbon-monoxide dehydrogenase small subunit
MFAAQGDWQLITYIEWLAHNGTFDPMHVIFLVNHGLQWGYFTPGMIMATTAYLKDNPNPSEADIRHNLEGNICRCTGYQNIVKAVTAAAGKMGGGD